jgi:hypothetical protein
MWGNGLGWSGRAPAPNKSWEGVVKPWIEAARKRLHHNVLAIALANRLARIVLAKGRAFELTMTDHASVRPA